MTSKLIIALIYAIIFFTGAAGLIYEVTWQRYLTRLLGSDSIAIAIILGVFLGGLSTGYFLCGKISFRIKNHFKAYALMEGLIGAWCIFFPQLFDLTNTFTKSWSFAPPVLIIIQGFICSAILMGIPTICMGSTIPFLTQGISRSITEATSTHARVYAINTGGAFVGTLLAGFFLIPEFGLPITIMSTAFLNISAGLTIFIAQKFLPGKETKKDLRDSLPSEAPHHAEKPSPRFNPHILYIIAFLSGFYVMALENVIIRITNLSLGSSSYTFSLIIAVFILAIALGSYFIANRQKLTRRALYFNQVAITISLLVIYFSLDLWPYAAHHIRIVFQSNIFGFWAYYATVFLSLLILLLVPVGLMGATVPLAFHEIKRELKEVGRHSGSLFSCNTVGSLCGSLIGGIVLYHFFDNPQIFLIAILFASLSSLLASQGLPKQYAIFAIAMAVPVLMMVFAPPFYEKLRFARGTFRIRSPLPQTGSSPNRFYQSNLKDNEVLFYKDGISATVAVIKAKAGEGAHESRSIVVNGKSDSDTSADIKTLKLSAQLPGLFARQRQEVMVVGLGTGMTAGEFTLYPEIKNIDVAEISPSVVEALPYFADFNYNLHKNPKVKIHIADAFRFLGRNSKKYDIITSEPSNPWVTGIDQLFTVEFYNLVKEHLKPDGVFLQWIHAYASDIRMVGMVFNTVRTNFQSCHVFMGSTGDMLILASMKNIDATNVQNAKAYFNANLEVKTSLAKTDIHSFDDILVREMVENNYIADQFAGFGLQTMDNPRLHYIAGKCFFKGSTLPPDAVYNSKTARYHGAYLLSKLEDAWMNNYLAPDKATAIDKAIENITGKGSPPLPILNGFRLKNMYQAYTHGMTRLNNDQTTALGLLTIAMRYPQFNDWHSAGINANASHRKKAEIILNQMKKYRSWIFPYNIDGLKNLLREGISSGPDVEEQNWFAVQLIAVLMEQEGNQEAAIKVFRNLHRNKNGKIILDAESRRILSHIKIGQR